MACVSTRLLCLGCSAAARRSTNTCARDENRSSVCSDVQLAAVPACQSCRSSCSRCLNFSVRAGQHRPVLAIKQEQPKTTRQTISSRHAHAPVLAPEQRDAPRRQRRARLDVQVPARILWPWTSTKRRRAQSIWVKGVDLPRGSASDTALWPPRFHQNLQRGLGFMHALMDTFEDRNPLP